jgi:PAS domain S-box-containing protein
MLASLRAASRALAHARDFESVLATVMRLGRDAGDGGGAIVITTRPNDTLEVLATTYGDDARHLLDGAPLDRDWPINHVLRTGDPVWLHDEAEIADRYPDLAGRVSQAWAGLPLRVDNRVIGCFGVGFVGAQAFDEAQQLYLLALADLCAIVLDRHLLEQRGAEHQLRALIDSNVIGVISGDIEHILEANDAFLSMIGRARSELSAGLDFREVTAPEFRDADDRAIAQADATGHFGPYEKEFLRPDGTRVPARAVGAIISVEGRGRWISIIEDLTEERRVEESLRATTARLATLMRHAPVGFAFIDQDFRFQLVNEKLAEINGIPVLEHLGRFVHEIVPDLAEANDELFRRVLAGETIVEHELRAATQAAPDRKRDWLVNYYPVRDQHREILGIGATVTEITERNLQLVSERSARTEAVESARLSETLSSISTAVANANDDDTIAHDVGRGLVEALHADAVLVASSDPTGLIETVLFAHGYAPEDIAEIRNDPQRDQWSTSIAIPARAPVFYDDPTEFLARFPFRADYVKRIGARSWGVAPLAAGDHVLGFVVVLFRSAHHFTDDERRFVATVADVGAQALLRARARVAEALARRSAEMLAEAIAAERARLAAVLHRMPAGLIVVEAMTGRRRVVLSNTRAAEILGGPPDFDDAEEWLALRDIDGQPMPLEETPLRRALRGEEVGEPEDALVIRDDGTTRRIRTTAVPIRDADQRTTSAVLVIEDVTDAARRERDAQLLAKVSDLLGSPHNVAEMLERVVSLAVPTFADVCSVYVLDDDELFLFAVADCEANRGAWMRSAMTQPIPVASDAPIAAAVRRGQSVLVPIMKEFEPRALTDDQAAWVRSVLQPRSILVVPLRSGERVTGALIFTQTEQTQRQFTAEDLDVAIELASRCALLLEQVVAHQETARARDRADRLQRFAAAAARAASVDAVAAAIISDGNLSVDSCMVNITMRHNDGTSAEVMHTGGLTAQDSVRWRQVHPRYETASLESLTTGRPVYYTNRSAYAARFPETNDLLDDRGVEAVAGLPLYGSDGHVMGSLAFAFASSQPFDEDQCGFLETVADVAGQSLDRARLYERDRDVARALQIALLPSALPELDDVLTEARYIAGGAGVAVGGDWYDVMRFADGRVGLLIGDAAGRGVEAAALMGKVRHAAAALAMDRGSPASVLSRVNEYLHTLSQRRTMLTCCYMVLDRDTGILRYASAGHPPPVIIERDGEPRFLNGGRGVPLGVVPTATYTDADHQLTDATTLVLYTDGLVERRGETIDVGLARLLDVTRGHGADIADLCNHLTHTLLEHGSDDDVALLVARVLSVASHARLDLELPADSRRLHELRTRVTRWLADAGVKPALIPDVVIALNEAASNSMLHAYSGATTRGHVRVSVAVAGNSVTATVADEGHWRPPAEGHDGRGIELMHSLMNTVRVDRSSDGTRVHLVRSLPGAD